MNIAIIPYEKELLDEPEHCPLYRKLKAHYAGSDIKWRMLSEFQDWKSVDYFVFCNFYYPWGIGILKEINRLHMRNRVIFCMMEPETVHFYHAKRFIPFIKKFTDCIITWNRNLIDGKTVFFTLFHSWQVQEEKRGIYQPKRFDERKLICNISGNKKSNHPNELYSERRKVIEYFEKNHSDDFDLYGIGWDKRKYKNYKGRCESKEEIYQNYRFALCLENEKNVPGYITEKIMDCISDGIVPIYMGATDITDYIPQDCFIPYDQFGTLEELYSYLTEMDERHYSAYLQAHARFIDEKRYEDFTAEAWSANVLMAIRQFTPNGPLYTGKQWFFMLDLWHKIYILLLRAHVIGLLGELRRRLR